METRERIIKTVLKHVCLSGYKDVSLSDVAGEVGIAKASLYHHFKGKDDIFLEVINYFFSLWGKWISDIFTKNNDLKTCLLKMLTSYDKMDAELQEILNSSEEFRFGVYYLVFDSIRLFPQFGEIFAKNNEEMAKVFYIMVQEAHAAGLIKKEISFISVFSIAGALIEGINIFRVLDKSIDPNEMGKRCFDIIWDGMKA
ncbi:MAG: TetR/AcrR family transcriptional regulator [bacterium]|nr:TetR/AcrR family transcriptional regulator [bacterium]